MKVKLLQWDQIITASQLKTQKDSVVGAQEIRVSEELWTYLLKSTDADFYDNVVVTNDNSMLEKGFLGQIFDMNIMSKIVIKNKTLAEQLPGLCYLLFYLDELPGYVAPGTGIGVPNSAPAVDLLDLAAQVI